MHSICTESQATAESSLNDAERQRLLVDWNKTEVEYPRDRCLHQLFEEQAERTPDAVAVTFEQQCLTYRELNKRANRLAHHLQDLGVNPDDLVGLCVEPSVDMLVAVLGILKAGGAYVPLDPSYPQARLDFMVSDAQLRYLVTDSGCREIFRKSLAKTVAFDEFKNKLSTRYPNTNPARSPTSDHLAYVIYTSGSTGRPKGVLVPHRCVVNYLLWAVKYYEVDVGGGAPVHSSMSFDLTVTSLFTPLLVGRQVRVIRAGFGVEALGQALRLQSNFSLVKITPAHLHLLREELGAEWAARRARFIVIGGEALSGRSVEFWQRHAPDTVLVNEYGPTETTVGCCVYFVPKAQDFSGDIPIGRPIANTQLYILDEDRKPVPIGTPGELYIGGAGVVRGYLNRPELTAERFVPNPFSSEPNARLYKTGDLCRYYPDGNVEFLGRMDHQVKIRGFRIELGEIESLLGSHPGVQDAVVVVKENGEAGKRLVAYAEVREFPGPEVAELREFLQAKLPDYMVPAAIVKLTSFPLNANGKIDRGALPEPDEGALVRDSEFVAPRTPTQEKLAAIWSEVLGVAKIGVHDNFFDLGGHSLNAIQIVSRVRVTLSRDLPIRFLFEQPTIEQLSAALEQVPVVDIATAGKTHLLVTLAGCRSRTQTGPAPVSINQAQLWFLQRLDPQSCVYNLAQEIRFTGELDEVALRRSLEELFRRHEVLRTRFEEVDGQPVQVPSDLKPDLLVLDLRDLPPEQRTAEVRRLAQEEISRPFDLANGPLVRTTFVRVGAAEHVLLFGVHHILFDGWSTDVLVRDLLAGYEACHRSGAATLPDLEVRFLDFADWQRKYLRSEQVPAHLAFWRQELAGVPTVLDLPNKLPAGNRAERRHGQKALVIPRDAANALRRLGQGQGATLFATLLAAFQAVLHRHTGQQQFLIGIPFTARPGREVENTIGFFVNSLPVRADFAGDPSFVDLLSQIQRRLWMVQSHQDLPFEQLVRALPPERNGNRNPFFQILVAYEVLPEAPRQCDGLKVQVEEILPVQPMFDLTVLLRDCGREVEVILLFDRRCYDDFAVSQLAGHFETLLAGVVANPQTRISALPLLTSPEKKQLLEEWNATAVAYPRDKCIHQLFEEQVERTPDGGAVVFEDQRLTYRELNDRANQLAHQLRDLGVGAEVLVGICLERSVEMVVGLLGILKAGGAYAPLDPSYPNERLRFMLDDSKISILLTGDRFSLELPTQTRILPVNQWVTGARRSNPLSVSSSNNLAYAIYTSGSTGLPKGVAVTHRSVLNLIAWHDQVYALKASHRASQVASLSFDASVWEVWPYLSVGAAVYIAPDSVRYSPLELIHWLANNCITHTFLPTALAEEVIRAPVPQGLSLQAVFTGGDKLRCRPNPALPFEVFNHYGPTESTVVATMGLVSTGGRSELISIGRPIANTEAYILDNSLQPVPIGVAGELHIGGDGLARGYLNRPELTAEKFILNPFSTNPGARLYKTADRCRYLPDGNIEFLGRIDQQVKIRGFRIELGEVEAVLGSHPAIQGAVVVVREGGDGDKKLVSYVVPREQPGPGVAELREFLKAKLPDFMVPGAFVKLVSFPLNANGKIDRGALPAPEEDSLVREADYVAPRTAEEQKVATIWSEVLAVEKVGIHDNFFDLGGHSLLAVKLQAITKKKLGKHFDLASLFNWPTVAEFATVLEGEPDANGASRVWLPKASVTKRPLLYLRSLSTALRLSKALGESWPVIGIECPIPEEVELWSRSKKSNLTIQQMAVACVDTVRITQARGPYILAGVCFDGILALEVARLLRAQGEQVALLCLLDAAYPKGLRLQSNPLIRRCGYHVSRLMEKGPSYFLRILANQFDKGRRELARLKNEIAQSEDPELMHRRFLHQLVAAYEAEPYFGDVLVFRAIPADEPKSFIVDWGPKNGWQDIVRGKIQVVDIQCRHADISQEPSISQVAQQLLKYLNNGVNV